MSIQGDGQESPAHETLIKTSFSSAKTFILGKRRNLCRFCRVCLSDMAKFLAVNRKLTRNFLECCPPQLVVRQPAFFYFRLNSFGVFIVIRPMNRFFRLPLVSRALVCLIAVALLVSSNRLQAAPKHGNSLDWVPADASYYTVGFRYGEQIDLLLKSNAWKTFSNMGSIQLGWAQAKAFLAQPGGPIDEYQKIMLDPENKDLETLAKELFATEVFVIGDKQFAPTFDMLKTAYSGIFQAALVAGFSAEIKGERNDPSPEEMMAAFFFILNERINDVVIPNTLIGFKIKSTEIAEKQLQRLELLVTRLLAAQAPPLVDRFKRVKVGGGNFLSMTIEGDLIPWDEIPWAEIESEAGQFDKLRNKLRQLKLNVSLGVKDGYLLLSIGNNNDYLTKLGTGPLLLDTPECKPLLPHLGPELWSVGYQSRDMRSTMSGMTKEAVQSYSDVLYAMLLEVELPEDLKARLEKDLKSLTTDIKGMVPEIGASLSWTKHVPQGLESWSYDWSENLYTDTSKPLDILKHVGGNPLLVISGRGKYRPEDYDFVAKWAKTAYGYFEQYGLPQIPESERPQVEKVLSRVLPMFKKFDEIVRTQLLPAGKDGQSAFVIDRKIESKQWIGPMPPSDNPLPFFEMAIVSGISDAEKLKAGVVGIRGIVDDVVALIKEMNPGEIPADYKIPDPKSRPLGEGTVWWYDLPAQVQDQIALDKQILPHWGMVKSVAVAGTSPRQTALIFSGTPFVPNSFLREAVDKPLSNLTHVQIGGLFDTFVPWIDYGFGLAMQETQDTTQRIIMSSAMSDIKTTLRVLGCMKSYSSFTRTEGTATVTQSLLEIEDLK